MQETSFNAIILKKQPYKEADEIITLFTKENGKIRALAKAIKLPKSKLQQKLQALFFVNVRLTSGKLPTIIEAEIINSFHGLRENLNAMKMAFYATELILKITADEHKNELLFDLLQNFLKFLDVHQSKEILQLGLAKFKIQALKESGLEMHINQSLLMDRSIRDSSLAPLARNDTVGGIYFSPDKGGFVSERQSDSVQVDYPVAALFIELQNHSFEKLKELPGSNAIDRLQPLLSQFIEYHLERKLKSESFINMV